MRSKEHAFYYGYIIVLCLCFLYKICCIFRNFEFELWNQIIVAATVSTCFFCISDIFEQIKDIKQYKSIQLIALEEKTISLAEEILNHLGNMLINEGIDTSENESDDLRSKLKESLFRDNNNNSSQDKRSFIFDIIGFVVFLCILIFRGIYSFLLPWQDLLTLFAFIVILSCAAYKEHRLCKINEYIVKKASFINHLDIATRMIDIYEYKKGKKDNGQVKNENS